MAHNADYVYQNLAEIATGIFLNIDNNMLTACQKAANAAMIKVCGSTENCDELIVDNGLGSRSLEYKICEYTPRSDSLNIDYNLCRPNIDMITDQELGRNSSDITTGSEGSLNYTRNAEKPFAGVIDGLIYWESVDFNDNGIIDVVKYWNTVEHNQNGEEVEVEHKEKVNSELAALQTSVQNVISAIEEDPKVKYCMTGREFQGYKEILGSGSTTNPRFPNLTAQMRRTISASALSQIRMNYYEKYDELNAKMLKDYSKIAERKAIIAGQNEKDQRREIARRSCLWLADMSSLARSAEPPKSQGGKILAAAAITAAAIAIPFTGGSSMGLVVMGKTIFEAAGVGTALVAGAGVSAAGVGLGIDASSGNDSANGEQRGFVKDDSAPLVASKEMNQWNYKETITTTFDWENLICHKCVRSAPCAETKNPFSGNKYCKTWGEVTEECTDTQF